MLTNIKIFTRVILAGLLLAIILGCASGPTRPTSFYGETFSDDKYYREAADQWVDYGF
jgi:hypothetical protein